MLVGSVKIGHHDGVPIEHVVCGHILQCQLELLPELVGEHNDEHDIVGDGEDEVEEAVH